MAATCPTCGANLAAPGSPCPSCAGQAPDVEALLAEALKELRTLRNEQVHGVMEAATALVQAASRTIELSGTITLRTTLSGDPVVVSVGDAATSVDLASAEVVGSELPPATGSLLKELGRLATRKNLTAVGAAIGTAVLLAKGCNDILGKPTVINIGTGNVSVVQQLAPAPPPIPPSARKAPDNSAPAAPKPGEPPPLLKRP